jgi:predicted enzyme related to lactoylglutathione lyase
MQRVTGLGGVFLKAQNPKLLCEWYQKHLGIEFNGETYMSFKWINQNHESLPGSTVFSFFNQDTKYFEPSSCPYMINFRVKDLKALLHVLKEEGVRIEGEMLEEDYGKFAWIMDPEGNKIELWEPADEKI